MVLAAAADDLRSHLAQLGVYTRANMKSVGFDTGRSDSQIIPLVLGSNDTVLRCANALTTAGFSVSAIRPPTVPAGTSRLRISLNANLSFSDIDRFLNALVAVRETDERSECKPDAKRKRDSAQPQERAQPSREVVPG